MKTNIFKLTALFLVFVSTLSSCIDKKTVNTIDKQKFCLFANTENINQTIPVINEFLSGQSKSLSDKQKLQELVTELKSCPCIVDATILHISGIYTLPPQSEISISFNENDTTRTFILDISMGNPLKAGSYHESNDDNENNKTCDVENPLTDLPWLKAEVDKIILLFQEGNSLSVSIYECVYGDKEAGFLVDKGNIKPFYNCSGEVLCIMGGYAGETCSELNIVSEKLIWTTDSLNIIIPCNFENPLTDLPWLKAEVDKIILLFQDGNPLSVSIYECVYGNKETGFLVDKGNIKPFYNCSGEVLCIMGGDAGETCSELNIISEKLIWTTDSLNIIIPCNFENPLTDLPWLKEIIDRLEGDKLTHARIYQCTYKNGIGFLLELCVGCPDYGFELMDCDGNRLCILDELAGDLCTEFAVDFENKKLIWEINRNDDLNNKLQGTKWKLAGIVDVETGALQELEPKDCEGCYVLTFDTDSTLSGYGFSNELVGKYKMGNAAESIQILIWQATFAGVHPNEKIYLEFLNKAYRFSLQGDKLLLYFEGGNHLLFTLL